MKDGCLIMLQQFLMASLFTYRDAVLGGNEFWRKVGDISGPISLAKILTNRRSGVPIAEVQSGLKPRSATSPIN